VPESWSKQTAVRPAFPFASDSLQGPRHSKFKAGAVSLSPPYCLPSSNVSLDVAPDLSGEPFASASVILAA